jgi:hypothetical protein
MQMKRFVIFTIIILLTSSLVIKASEKQLNPEDQWVAINFITYDNDKISQKPILSLAVREGSGWENVIKRGNNVTNSFLCNVSNFLSKLPEENKTPFTSDYIKQIFNPENVTDSILDQQSLFLYTYLVPIILGDHYFLKFALQQEPNFLRQYMQQVANRLAEHTLHEPVKKEKALQKKDEKIQSLKDRVKQHEQDKQQEALLLKNLKNKETEIERLNAQIQQHETALQEKNTQPLSKDSAFTYEEALKNKDKTFQQLESSLIEQHKKDLQGKEAEILLLNNKLDNIETYVKSEIQSLNEQIKEREKALQKKEKEIPLLKNELNEKEQPLTNQQDKEIQSLRDQIAKYEETIRSLKEKSPKKNQLRQGSQALQKDQEILPLQNQLNWHKKISSVLSIMMVLAIASIGYMNRAAIMNYIH